MKTNLNTLILFSALLMPALNYGQSASNAGMATSFASYLSKGDAPMYFTPITDAEILINVSDIIKPNMTPSKLMGGVNSEYPELGAMVSPDSKTLYFSRYQDPNNTAGLNDDEDIWYADWNEATNTWGEARNIGAPLNNKHPNYINSISPDGNTLLLGNTYFANGKMGQGLSISNRTADGWGFPKEIKIEGHNKHAKWAGCHLSDNQKILMMASEHSNNTHGDRDIYVSFIKADNSWTKPMNLGKMINTKGTESAPFLAADDSTLYFTSDGLAGYGGNDIYVSYRLDATWQNWSEPKNLGPNVNTESNQSFFTVSNDIIYFSSENGSTGNLDVYTIALPGTKKAVTEMPTLVAETQGTNNNTNDLSVASINSEIGTSVIFFNFNNFDLKKNTAAELDNIAKTLKESPYMQLEVSGHADNIGSEKYNYQLAQKRIDAILNYLKNHSEIDEKRVIVKNYGETMPLAGNETEKGRALNRRVEMAIKTKLLTNN